MLLLSAVDLIRWDWIFEYQQRFYRCSVIGHHQLNCLCGMRSKFFDYDQLEFELSGRNENQLENGITVIHWCCLAFENLKQKMLFNCFSKWMQILCCFNVWFKINLQGPTAPTPKIFCLQHWDWMAKSQFCTLAKSWSHLVGTKPPIPNKLNLTSLLLCCCLAINAVCNIFEHKNCHWQ